MSRPPAGLRWKQLEAGRYSISQGKQHGRTRVRRPSALGTPRSTSGSTSGELPGACGVLPQFEQQHYRRMTTAPELTPCISEEPSSRSEAAPTSTPLNDDFRRLLLRHRRNPPPGRPELR